MKNTKYLLPKKENTGKDNSVSQKIYGFWLYFALGSTIFVIGLILFKSFIFTNSTRIRTPKEPIYIIKPPLITPPITEPEDTTNPTRKPPPSEDDFPEIKTEVEFIEELNENLDLKKYNDYISKFPSSSEKNNIIHKLKSKDPKLPDEEYWRIISRNDKGYWEMKHKNIEMVWIPPGKYSVGYDTDGENKDLNIDGFWIGKYEISVLQYRQYCKENTKAVPNVLFKDDEPIRNIDWHEASDFCRWAGCRLPTENEWEIAARGKSPFGFDGENGYGIFDVIGNIDEWCQDSKDDIYKILMGGVFAIPERKFVARRNYIFPSTKQNKYGFRIVMD